MSSTTIFFLGVSVGFILAIVAIAVICIETAPMIEEDEKILTTTETN